MPSQVLIVDDDPALLEALSATLRLRMEDTAVDTCDSAWTALDRIRAADYDAIVADIKMPAMDGMQLLAEIRKVRPTTPTLLITGHGEHDLAVQALRSGANDYIQKPIDRDYFVASLSRAIQCHQLSRQVATQRSALADHVQELETCLQERTHELREFFHREQQAHAALDEAHRQQEELIAMIAHDFGQPLTVVRGYAELLARSDASKEVQQRASRIILSEIDRMSRLAKDLADAARLSIGQFQIRRMSGDLGAIVREQVEAARLRGDRHTIHLQAPPGEVPIICDRDRLAQVLSNLITNAIKHTAGGAIRVRLWVEDEQASFSVSDEGPGIAPDYQQRIFEPYYRYDEDDPHDKLLGAGLGLYIAEGIVKAHGGGISVESRVGEGATFNVWLPLPPASRSVAGVSEQQASNVS
jgi:two-component system sensor histidine kinase/response regulator